MQLVYVTLLQNDKSGDHIPNSQTSFFFCFAKYMIFTESTQATNWR